MGRLAKGEDVINTDDAATFRFSDVPEEMKKDFRRLLYDGMLAVVKKNDGQVTVSADDLDAVTGGELQLYVDPVAKTFTFLMKKEGPPLDS